MAGREDETGPDPPLSLGRLLSLIQKIMRLAAWALANLCRDLEDMSVLPLLVGVLDIQDEEVLIEAALACECEVIPAQPPIHLSPMPHPALFLSRRILLVLSLLVSSVVLDGRGKLRPDTGSPGERHRRSAGRAVGLPKPQRAGWWHPPVSLYKMAPSMINLLIFYSTCPGPRCA